MRLTKERENCINVFLRASARDGYFLKFHIYILSSWMDHLAKINLKLAWMFNNLLSLAVNSELVVNSMFSYLRSAVKMAATCFLRSSSLKCFFIAYSLILICGTHRARDIRRPTIREYRIERRSWRRNWWLSDYFSPTRGPPYWNCTRRTETEEKISAY